MTSSMAAVCTALAVFLLAIASQDPSPQEMKSISYNASDGSLRVENDTPKPALKDGDVLIKVPCM